MIDALTGAPRRLTLGGEVYDVHPLTLADLGKLQAWLDTQLPDPLDAVGAFIARTSPPMEVQKHLYTKAVESHRAVRVLLGTPEAGAYINSPDGVIELLHLSIARGRPDFTREKAREVFEKMTPADVIRLQKGTELDQVQEPADPKAGTA